MCRMAFKVIVTFLCLLVGTVFAETIHFTNSVKHLQTTKNFTTYEVEVPGSRPITIIEANPEDTSSGKQQSAVRYRNAAGATVEDHAHVVVDDGIKANSMKKTLYSPDLLNKFLKEYSEKLKNADPITRQKLNEISLINNNNFNVEKVEKPTGNQGKEEQVNPVDVHERHVGNSKWFGDNRKTHPWNSKDGWVTMEAVPWSESKVSKWQSNTNKHNSNRNQNSYQLNQWNNNESEESTGTYRPKPMYLMNSASAGGNNYAIDDDDDYGDGGLYAASGRPSTIFTSERPSKPTFDSFYNRRYKPSEDYNRKSSSHNSDYSGDTWYDHGFKKPSQTGDIITDGRKPNFPQYAPSARPNPQVSTTDRNHPPSYPESGNGEWVLISTTKGYQYPRRQGQRAITFTPQASAVTHKSVKLTVLPMKNSLDMTTSHNGLIEVSSSTQTVEQAFKQQQQQQQQNNKIATSTPAPIRKRRVIPQFSLMRQDNGQLDSSAVLAAVSAGMVPATLAVLAPMVLGRKRRSSTAHHPHAEQLLAPKF